MTSKNGPQKLFPSQFRSATAAVANIAILLIALSPLALALKAPDNFLANAAIVRTEKPAEETPNAVKPQKIVEKAPKMTEVPKIAEKAPKISERKKIAAKAPKITEKVWVPKEPSPTIIDRPTGLRYELGPGDKIRIKIRGQKDLSSNYVVRADGSLAVPGIPPVIASNKDVRELEAALKASYKKATNKSTAIAVEVAERRPFYVRGYVEKPGAYPSLPAMTVSHALSVAGGLYRPPAPIIRPQVTPAESSATSTNQSQGLFMPTRLKSALAKKARLEAELNNEAKIVVPEKLKKLAKKAEIKKLLAREQDILKMRRADLAREYKSKEQAAVLAADEVKALQGQMEQLAKQSEIYSRRLAKHKDLRKRGLARKDAALNIEMLVAKADAEKHKLEVEIARAKREVQQAERAKEALRDNRKMEVGRELRVVEETITDNTPVTGAVPQAQAKPKPAPKKIEQTPSPPVAALTPTTPKVEFFLTRRTKKDSFEKINVDAQTTLKPGDVLYVEASDNKAESAQTATTKSPK